MTRFEEIFFQILYVVVALFAHKKLTYEFSVPKYAILSLGFSILLTVAIFRLIRKKKGFELNLGHVLLLGFAVSALLSTINVYRDRPFYFIYSIDIALYTLLNAFTAIYITNYFKEKNRITRFLMVMIATGGFIAFDALLNFYTGKDIFLGSVGSPFNRASIKATIGNTIFVANYLGMIIPTTLYFILSYDFGWKVKSYLRIALVKMLATFSLVLMIITVIVSQTRSEYGGVFLTNLFFFIFYFYYLKFVKGKDKAKEEMERKDPEFAKKLSRLQKTLIFTAIVLVALSIIVYNLPTPLTGHGRFTIARRVEAIFSRGSWDERILAWLSSVAQWKDHKILGTGIGTYQILTISYMGDIIKKHPRFIYGWNNFKRTHNDYFQILGETGIVGFSFMMALLIFLVVYFFRTLKRIDDRDDALLFIALAMGFADFAIQSFFSFPGHLLPNTLGAIFLASAALSRHFNKDGWMTFKIPFRFATVMLLIVALGVTYASTYMRWRYFISEVHFKAGNSAYMTLIKIREEESKARNILRDLENMKKELETLSGRFSYLKPEEFRKRKIAEFNAKGLKISDVEIEKMRLQEIEKIRSQIDSKIAKVRDYLSRAPKLRREFYEKALENLVTCLNLNHAYGKAYFYIAALSVQPERISDLNRSIKTVEDFRKFFNQEFDIFQRFIHPSKKRTDLKVFDMLFSEVEDPISLVNEIGKENIIITQVMLDSISLYETSLIVFNERNTYKAIAGRFSNLHQAGKVLMARLKRLEKSHEDLKPKIDMIVKSLESRTVEYFEDFVEYAKITIHNLPGSWNRFPDWKHYDVRRAVRGEDIYRFFANRAVEIQPMYVKPNYEFLKWLAEEEVWACEKMDEVGVWGVPDMLMDFMHAEALIYFSLKMANEALRVMEYNFDLYASTLERIEKQMEKWRDRAMKELENKIEDLESYIDTVLADLGEARKDLLRRKIKEYYEEAFEKFENMSWIGIVADEMRKFLDRKYTYRLNPWNDVLYEAHSKIRDLVLKMTTSPDKAQKFYNAATNVVRPGPAMYIYERYLRFKAHYNLMLNDAQNLLSKVEDSLEKNPDPVLKDFANDPIFNEPLKTKEDVKKFLDSFKERLVEERKRLR